MSNIRSILSVLLFTFISLNSFCQQIEFDIHHKSLADFLLIEKGLGSEKYVSQSTHVSGKGVAQPLIFKLKQKLIPDLLTYYYFYSKDSTMYQILYEWDVANFKKGDNNVQSEDVLQAFIKKYEDLERQIDSKFGIGKIRGSLDYSKIKDGLDRRNDWQPNDSTNISMYTYLSNRFEKNGNITINPTARIRLYINKESKQNPKQPTKQAIDSLHKVTIAFMSALYKKDLIIARTHLSKLIADKTTDEQLKELTTLIHFDRRVIIFNTGTQLGLDGSIFSVLQYKYDDTSEPPLEIVKMMFDDNFKITGAIPLNRTPKVN